MEFMQNDWVWQAYWLGVLVYGLSLVKEIKAYDFLISFGAALLWPVFLPVRLIRKILK